MIRHLIFLASTAALAVAHAAGQNAGSGASSPVASANPPPSGVSDSSLNVPGIFNSELPGIERKYQLKLILHPHVGDFTRYDYMRTAIGLRYSTSSHLELSAETNTYFAHGLRHVRFFQESGFVDARFGFKYRLGENFWRGWDTGVGASYQVPFGSPPAQLTDGFKHFTPFITFARPLPNHPNLRFFWRLGVDAITPTGIQGRRETNELTDDSNSVGAGFVWDRGTMNYTFEASYETTRLLGSSHDDVFTVRPGFIWEIPSRFTFHSRGQWLFGVALRLSEGPDGFDVGLGGKLRLSFDFKRLFRRSTNPSQN